MIEDILTDMLGTVRHHNETKGQIAFDCPNCSAYKNRYDGDGKGNLEVNYNKNVFQCWSCADTGTSGTINKLIKMFGKSVHFEQFKKYLRDYHVDYEIPSSTSSEIRLPKEYKLIKSYDYQSFTEKKVISYLKKRGISLDICLKNKIGYCEHGEYQDRIIIPSLDRTNSLNYFIGRDFTGMKKMKYMNPEVPKSEIIFNSCYLNFDSTIVIVEGIFDSIVIPNSIPLLGKNVSEMMMELLYFNHKSNIVIFLDGDAWETTKKIYYELNSGCLKGKVKMVKTPEGYDPSLVFERFGGRGIVRFLRSSFKFRD